MKSEIIAVRGRRIWDSRGRPTVEGDAEIMLKREQLMLRGRGVISLGHTSTAPDAEIVTFAVG